LVHRSNRPSASVLRQRDRVFPATTEQVSF